MCQGKQQQENLAEYVVEPSNILYRAIQLLIENTDVIFSYTDITSLLIKSSMSSHCLENEVQNPLLNISQSD